MNRDTKNFANQFTIILLIAIFVNLVCYGLPDSILGFQIKKVDLLSDIRKPVPDDLPPHLFADNKEYTENDLSDSTRTNHTALNTERTSTRRASSGMQKNGKEISQDVTSDNQGNDNVRSSSTDSAGNDNQGNSGNRNQGSGGNNRTDNSGAGNSNNAGNDRAINTGTGRTDNSSAGSSNNTGTGRTDNSVAGNSNNAGNDNSKSAGSLDNTQIEDFSSGHNGLMRFFHALNNIDNLGRPVRIAFVGDSFIEGDILVADFRAKMQEHFGGRGVGFVPVTSVTEQYRPTIKQSADGWKTYSIIKDRSRKYVISGVQFEPTSKNASIRFQTVDMYPGLEEVSSLKFIYAKNNDTEMHLKVDEETYPYKLPPTEGVTQFELTGQFKKGVLQFKNAEGLKAIGIALEDNYGVVVDNFALRGNSGIVMSELDGESCRNFQQIRPYDLIVMQYGLNVASDSVRDYSWYRNRMVPVIEHIQDCFPGADILILSVSDRSRNGKNTMPAVLSLLRAQRQMAESAEVTFWNVFAAMGGENSIIKYVNSNWASKDYTHLSFRGGRELANALFDALITEKKLYAENENPAE